MLQQLVFSDEFSSYSSGTLGGAADLRWTAMDFHYSSDKNEWQNYKPEQVKVEDGKLLLTLEDKNSTGIGCIGHRTLCAGHSHVWKHSTGGARSDESTYCNLRAGTSVD